MPNCFFLWLLDYGRSWCLPIAVWLLLCLKAFLKFVICMIQLWRFCMCLCVHMCLFKFLFWKTSISHICVWLYMWAYLYLCLPSHRFTYMCLSMNPVLTHRTLPYLFPTVSDTLKKLILGYKMGQSLFPF